MNLLLRFCISVAALLVVAYVLPGVEVKSLPIAIVATVLLGILNATVRPILVLLTLPVTILTLGLFMFCINAGILLITAYVLDGFFVASFGTALIGSILLTLVSGIMHRILV